MIGNRWQHTSVMYGTGDLPSLTPCIIRSSAKSLKGQYTAGIIDSKTNAIGKVICLATKLNMERIRLSVTNLQLRRIQLRILATLLIIVIPTPIFVRNCLWPA